MPRSFQQQTYDEFSVAIVSLVVFPFQDESLPVVASNLDVAARHDRVSQVWAVAATEDATMSRVAQAAADIAALTSTPVEVFSQERTGKFRPGKGDGLNTAIARSAERGFGRTHFYDADITNSRSGACRSAHRVRSSHHD